MLNDYAFISIEIILLFLMTTIKLMQLKFTIFNKKLLVRLTIFVSIFVVVVITDFLYVFLPMKI